MILWPRALAALAGFGPSASRLIPWLVIPVALTSLLVFASALLNALGAIGRLAILSVMGSAAMALGAWPAARASRRGTASALVALLIFSAAVSVATALAALVRFRGQVRVVSRSRSVVERARGGSFGTMSAAMLASGLAASGTLLAVRRHIILTQGLAVTGQFDAAWGLSMNQVTLVLSSLQTYICRRWPGRAVRRSATRTSQRAHGSGAGYGGRDRGDRVLKPNC